MSIPMHAGRITLVAYLCFILLFASSLWASPSHAAPAALFASATGAGTTCAQSLPCGLPSALSQALDGDTIYVAAGTYTSTTEAVVTITRTITLLGAWSGAPAGPPMRDPLAYRTILDGQSQRRVVLIMGDVSPTLEGFEIRNGSASEGAGIAIWPISSGNTIIRNNLITDNVAWGGWGGGIQADGGQPLIEHNRIVGNSTSAEGGGVSVAWYAHATLKDNLIAANSASREGAGVRLRDTWVSLVNNTIADNGGAIGDGIYAESTTITLTNNIVASNRYGLRTDGTITPTLTYNDIWNNSVANYAGLPDPTGTDGNISLDPLFVGLAAGDYYLAVMTSGQGANSPAIDAGSDTASNLGLDQRTTRMDGMPDQATVDLGYHYAPVFRAYLALSLR